MADRNQAHPSSLIKCGDLHSQLVKAHDAQDSEKLAELYTQAADVAQRSNNLQASGFYLTQALVFALEAGLDNCDQLTERLRLAGRI